MDINVLFGLLNSLLQVSCLYAGSSLGFRLFSGLKIRLVSFILECVLFKRRPFGRFGLLVLVWWWLRFVFLSSSDEFFAR